MDTRNDIEARLKMYEQKYAEMIKKGDLKNELAKIMANRIQEFKQLLKGYPNIKSNNTGLKILFHNNGREISKNTAKETYAAAVKEFGIPEVRREFPGLFENQNLKGKDLFCIAPNTYLITGLNNEQKKKNIEQIAGKLNRKITVTIIG